MRIVQINAVAEYSSTGRTTSELDKELKARGFESWIATPNVSDSEYTIKIGDRFDNKLHALYSRLFGRQGYYSKRSTKKLVRKLAAIRPDIVHLRNLHANYINLPILFRYLSENKVACVVTLHDCWPFTGHCCYFVDSGCNKWKMGCGACPDKHKWNSSWFFDFSKENLNNKKQYWNSIDRLAVVGVSDWVTNFVFDSILRDATIIKRIYNWIDLGIFRPNKVDAFRLTLGPADKPIILGIAQIWSRQKGILDFIQIAKNHSEWQFVLVGKLEEQLTLPENILIYGTTSSTLELVNLYNAADVFFNPSSRETFGKVTAESIACGTPVVGYDATATPELVSQGCGQIIPVGDLNGAENAIKRILDGPSLRESCREFAVKEFDKSKLVSEYIEVYQNLIDD